MPDKAEYFEMIPLFLVKKDTKEMLKVIKDNINNKIKNRYEIINVFENIFSKLNLKNE